MTCNKYLALLSGVFDHVGKKIICYLYLFILSNVNSCHNKYRIAKRANKSPALDFVVVETFRQLNSFVSIIRQLIAFMSISISVIMYQR